GCNRVVQSPNNVTFRYRMISQQLTDRLTGVISDRQIEYGLHGFHHARYSAVAIELIDEMVASRLNIGDTRNGAADGIELVGIKSMPSRPAMAVKWRIAFVDPPSAIHTRDALRNASRVMISEGL